MQAVLKEVGMKYDVHIKPLEEDKDSILVVIVYRDKFNKFARLPKDRKAIEQEVRKYWE